MTNRANRIWFVAAMTFGVGAIASDFIAKAYTGRSLTAMMSARAAHLDPAALDRLASWYGSRFAFWAIVGLSLEVPAIVCSIVSICRDQGTRGRLILVHLIYLGLLFVLI